jgi:hypothetical protein
MSKYDYLRTKGMWGAKSPDNEKIVAMAAALTNFKGKLEFDDKLAAIKKGLLEQPADEGSSYCQVTGHWQGCKCFLEITPHLYGLGEPLKVSQSKIIASSSSGS